MISNKALGIFAGVAVVVILGIAGVDYYISAKVEQVKESAVKVVTAVKESTDIAVDKFDGAVKSSKESVTAFKSQATNSIAKLKADFKEDVKTDDNKTSFKDKAKSKFNRWLNKD